MKNKKSMSLSIVILVLMTLFITGYCLVAFKLRESHLKHQVNFAGLEHVYLTEYFLNYNIDKIMEDSLSDTKDQFIANFKSELSKYKLKGDQFPINTEQVEEQLIPENIEIKDNQILLTLTLKISGYTQEGIYVNYEYTKTYEKQILQENI